MGSSHQAPEGLSVSDLAGLLDTTDPRASARQTILAGDPARGLLLAATTALYPELDIVDGACTIVLDGRQSSVHVSARASAVRAGEVVLPLRLEGDGDATRLDVDLAELGLSVEVHITGRDRVSELPPCRTTDGPHQRTRERRWIAAGTLAGRVCCDDQELLTGSRPLVVGQWWSVGTAPVDGVPTLGAPARTLPSWFAADVLVPAAAGDDGADPRASAIHVGVVEAPDGVRRWATRPETPVAVEWLLGTRWPAGVVVGGTGPGPDSRITLTPVVTGAWRGLGRHDPVWGWGRWHDELAVGRQQWRLRDLDPSDPANVGALQLCRVADGGRPGTGRSAFVRTEVVGPHEPSGLSGFLDGASAGR